MTPLSTRILSPPASLSVPCLSFPWQRAGFRVDRLKLKPRKQGRNVGNLGLPASVSAVRLGLHEKGPSQVNDAA